MDAASAVRKTSVNAATAIRGELSRLNFVAYFLPNVPHGLLSSEETLDAMFSLPEFEFRFSRFLLKWKKTVSQAPSPLSRGLTQEENWGETRGESRE